MCAARPTRFLISLWRIGGQIDLVFASVNMSSIPDNLDLRDNRVLSSTDEASIRSLNGKR